MIKHKMNKRNRVNFLRSKWLAAVVIIGPNLVLPWIDYWEVRFAAGLIFCIYFSIILLCVTFGSEENLKIPKKVTKYQPLIARIIIFTVWLWVSIEMSFPFFKGTALFAASGFKLVRCEATITEVKAIGAAGIIVRFIEIEGCNRKQAIVLFGVPKHSEVGQKQEFYFLPGTEFAVDIKNI